MDQRDEVRDFLSSRRARLNPTDVGLPAGTGRRRVAGLRRDEVAVLAGVSSEYYARLERGNLAGASDAVLDAIAAALRLDEAELLHLRNLAHAANQPARRRRTPTPRNQVQPSLQRVLDAMATVPAYVRDSRMDVVADNAMARELLSPVYRFAQHTGTPPNSARYAFLDSSARDYYPDWEQVTHDCVAALHGAAGHNPYDKPLSDLVGELSTRSETFRTLWATHDVRLHRTGIKRLRHPEVGVLALEYDVMDLTQQPGLVFIAYSSAPGTPAADGLALLASLAASRTDALTAPDA
ncbi:helix-turn-helix transcriptional regulator [Cellulomonas sp. APG4]|uniref:helix-turn-helix domain-containing protein n=1 Tax=Cellulomonas sp. APG4 TaxID=1538656 RepID=UPI00137A8452|nr:helix-turn-helix transcriptional regulator [Cellulomonas sp. APG4]NCT89529.1 helix-turn-helix transcriptional regulator [Cellulomonas sp. APG4]